MNTFARRTKKKAVWVVYRLTIYSIIQTRPSVWPFHEWTSVVEAVHEFNIFNMKTLQKLF